MFTEEEGQKLINELARLHGKLAVIEPMADELYQSMVDDRDMKDSPYHDYKHEDVGDFDNYIFLLLPRHRCIKAGDTWLVVGEK